jgi:hypothetical protein
MRGPGGVPHASFPSSPFSQPCASSDCIGSGLSQSGQRQARSPLPFGGSDKVIGFLHFGQAGGCDEGIWLSP